MCPRVTAALLPPCMMSRDFLPVDARNTEDRKPYTRDTQDECLLPSILSPVRTKANAGPSTDTHKDEWKRLGLYKREGRQERGRAPLWRLPARGEKVATEPNPPKTFYPVDC